MRVQARREKAPAGRGDPADRAPAEWGPLAGGGPIERCTRGEGVNVGLAGESTCCGVIPGRRRAPLKGVAAEERGDKFGRAPAKGAVVMVGWVLGEGDPRTDFPRSGEY